jgi:ferritin-like metal-binding protein YciE
MDNRTYDRTIRQTPGTLGRERIRDASEHRDPYDDNEYGYRSDRDQGNLVDTIRENPLPALLIGAGIGALIAGTVNRARSMQTDGSEGWFRMGRPSTREEMLEAWLNSAYGMERSLEQVLEHRLQDTEDQPEMHSKIQRHLEETQRHAERVRQCIERRGGSVSRTKGGLGAIDGKITSMSTEFAEDELVKNALADYAAEQFEVASYRSLVAAAEELGDEATARACRQNLEEDERMANWLAEQIPDVTKQYLGHLEQHART